MKGSEQGVRWLIGASVAVAMALVIAGCETAEGLAGLSLDQPEVTLGADEPHVRLTVVAGADTNGTLSLPLEWSVSDSTLGHITAASGFSATYVRNDAAGRNTVIAHDQYGNEGYSSVNQLAGTSYGLTLSVTIDGSETTVIPDGDNQAVITVSGESAQPPFTWAVTSGSGSIVSGQGGSSAVFQSNGAGSSAVQCTDDNGVIASVSITQAAPVDDGTDDGDTGGGGGPGDP